MPARVTCSDWLMTDWVPPAHFVTFLAVCSHVVGVATKQTFCRFEKRHPSNRSRFIYWSLPPEMWRMSLKFFLPLGVGLPEGEIWLEWPVSRVQNDGAGSRRILWEESLLRQIIWLRHFPRIRRGKTRATREKGWEVAERRKEEGVFDFQQKKGRNCEKRDRIGVSEGKGSMPGGRGRRMLSVILIASAPTEPWQIAEYLSAFLMKTDNACFMSLHLHSPLRFSQRNPPWFWDVFGVHSPPTTANFIGFSHYLPHR